MRGKEYAFFDRKAQLKRNVPVGTLMIVLSCFMWVGLFLFAYYSATLTLLYIRIRQEADLTTSCPSYFSANHSENFKKLETYPQGVAEPYIVRFSNEMKLSHHNSASAKIPTIVTAVSSAQFYQVQGLIRHLIEDIKPHFPALHLVVYDVGLYKREYDLLERYCHCDVRKFVTTAYPVHVADFTNFAWRPIIMQTTLNEFGSIIFLDPAARFKSSMSLKSIENRGWRDFMIWDLPSHVNVVAYTSPATFHYLGEERCTFQEAGMIDNEIFVLFESNKTWQLVMKPWLKCALSADCICPSGSRFDVCFHMRKPRTTGCHRYDMSALSIILNRALQVTLERNKYIPPRITYRSEEEEVIFPEQPWTNTELCLLLLIPVALYIVWMYVCIQHKPKFR